MKLMDVIRDKTATAKMLHIRDGAAYYQVLVDEKPYMFPVPLTEMNSGTFLPEDNVRIFQRWIRVALDSGNFDQLF